MLRRLLSALLVLALLAFPGYPPALAATPYATSDTTGMTLTSRYTFTNSGPSATSVTIDLPVPSPSSLPYQEVLGLELAPAPAKVTADAKGNRTATFEVANLDPGASFTVTVNYVLQNSTIRYGIDPPTVSADYNGAGPGVLAYLSPSDKIESDNPEIVRRAQAIVGSETNPYLKARQIFLFVRDWITYDPSDWSNQGALHALRTRTGVCYEYATLFVALARAVGVPARMQVGYGWTPDQPGIPLGANAYNASTLRHAWAEFYLPNYGWVPADPTWRWAQEPLHYFAYLPRGHLATQVDTSSIIKWSSYSTVDESEQNTLTLGVQRLTGAYELVQPPPLAFSDTTGLWAEKAIAALKLRGIVTGYPDGTFHPSSSLSRAEFVVLWAKARGLPPVVATATFTDTAGHWARGYIDAARLAGFASGYADGGFHPDSPISRAEIAAILARSLGLRDPGPSVGSLGDLDGHWAAPSIRAARGAGIVDGYPDGSYRPDNPATRAEGAAVIARSLGVAQ